MDEAFGRRLTALLDQRGMRQSDLARRLWGERIDRNGHRVARNRDRVSAWCRGRLRPNPADVRRLADALAVDPAELVPEAAAPAGNWLRVDFGPAGAWVDLRLTMPVGAAAEFMALAARHGL